MDINIGKEVISVRAILTGVCQWQSIMDEVRSFRAVLMEYLSGNLSWMK